MSAPFLGQVGCERLRVAGPGERDRLRRQSELELEVLGDLPGAFTREPGVVAIDRLESRTQWPVVGMADEVQAHVDAILHAVENLGERLDGR